MADQVPTLWSWIRECVEKKFDVLIIVVLLSMWIVFVNHLINIHASPEMVSWGREQAAEVQGALLGLITGIGIGRKIGGGNSPPGDKPSA